MRISDWSSDVCSSDLLVEHTLKLDGQIREWAQRFADKHHALFLGRGPSYPVALEGALKLKEVSYIHAEAYPAGELKHGPLAQVDADMSSEERRVGKECDSKCRSWWARYH